MGFTLNIITLLALALAVGIVIDDAIVVLENIYRFIEEKDCTPVPAAFAATKEIGLAVLATTLSLMAVFMPGRLHGRHRRPLPQVVRPDHGVHHPGAHARQLLAHAHAGRALAEAKRDAAQGGGIEPAANGSADAHRRRRLDVPRCGFYAPIERGYMAMLRWSMRHRWVVVLCVVVHAGHGAHAA